MSNNCFYDNKPLKCLQGRERHLSIFSSSFSSIWGTQLLPSFHCPAAKCTLISCELALGEIVIFQWWWKVMASPSSNESVRRVRVRVRNSPESSFQKYIVFINPSLLCSGTWSFISASADCLGSCRQLVHCQPSISLITPSLEGSR